MKLWPKLQQGRRQERGALKAPLSVSSPAALRYGHETIGEDSAGIRTRRLALGLRFLLKSPLHRNWNLEGQRHRLGRCFREFPLDDFAHIHPSAWPLVAFESAFPIGNHLIGNDLAVLGNDSGSCLPPSQLTLELLRRRHHRVEHAPNTVDIHESNQLGKSTVGKRADRNPERRVIRAVSLTASNRVLPRIRNFLAGKPVLEGVPVYSDHCRSPFFPNKYTRLVYLIKAPDYRAVALGLRGRQAPFWHPSYPRLHRAETTRPSPSTALPSPRPSPWHR